MKSGARIGPYTRHRPAVPHRGACRRSSDSIIWPNTRISQEAVVRALDPRPPLPHRPQRHRRGRRRARRQVGRSPTTAASVNRCIVHAQPRYLQGLRRPRHLPRRDQRRRGARHRRGVRRLSRRQAHRRRPRHAPVVAGARRGVHRRRHVAGRRRRRLRHDRRPTCCTSPSPRDGHDGGAQITASHNPKQYNGMKMVRARGVPAERRRRHLATSAT